MGLRHLLFCCETRQPIRCVLFLHDRLHKLTTTHCYVLPTLEFFNRYTQFFHHLTAFLLARNKYQPIWGKPPRNPPVPGQEQSFTHCTNFIDSVSCRRLVTLQPGWVFSHFWRGKHGEMQGLFNKDTLLTVMILLVTVTWRGPSCHIICVMFFLSGEELVNPTNNKKHVDLNVASHRIVHREFPWVSQPDWMFLCV